MISTRRCQDRRLRQSSLLQALQKNKFIQDRTFEISRNLHKQFIKEMESHRMKEKHNHQLLYLWKKEFYIRQLKRSIEDHEKVNEGVHDEHYDDLVRSVRKIIKGEQTLVVPPSEEERRSSTNAKVRRFLHENPPSSIQLKRFSRPSVISANSISPDENLHEIDPNLIGVEKTWKQIHAKSAGARPRTHVRSSPTAQRAFTARDSRRVSQFVTSSFQPRNSHSESPRRSKSNVESNSFSLNFNLEDEIENFLQQMDSLQKNINIDLVAMKSVRREKGNPTDLKTVYESRRKICEINRHALDVETHDRKSRLTVLRSLKRIRPETPTSIQNLNGSNDQKNNVDQNQQITNKINEI